MCEDVHKTRHRDNGTYGVDLERKQLATRATVVRYRY